MNYIPIMLNVSDRRIIIIGGGNAAFKKVRNLLNHEHRITVIASDFNSRFSDIPVEKISTRVEDPEQVDRFLEKENIVIIATDDADLNGRLELACREKNILYNRVDESRSPFIFPASFETNGVIVSVSTVGRTPSLTRYIRDSLRERIGELPLALPTVERLRNDCNIPDLKDKADFFRRLLEDPEFWSLISKGKSEEAYRMGIQLAEEFSHS